MMSEKDQLMLFAVDSRARITALQESAADWLATVARSGGRCIGSLLSAAPPGLSEKMYLASSAVPAAQTLERSSPAWSGGMYRPHLADGETPGWCKDDQTTTESYLQFSILNSGEWRRDAAVCSLSDILEASPDPKYSLSPKACAGILRRAAKRGRELPHSLKSALERMAMEAGTGTE